MPFAMWVGCLLVGFVLFVRLCGFGWAPGLSVFGYWYLVFGCFRNWGFFLFVFGGGGLGFLASRLGTSGLD